MNVTDLKNIISSCLNDVVFEYNHKKCGVTSEVHDYIPTFQAWCGNDTKEYSNVEDVFNDAFYDGKCLAELLCGKNSSVDFEIL